MLLGSPAFFAKSVTVDVTSPTITSSTTASNIEGVALAHALTANEAVTWSIVGGADQSQLEISGSTLRWIGNGTQDFEDPTDGDGNNTYIVDVRATDTALNTTDQTITVTVTNDPLEGTTPTFAVSMSRVLVNGYADPLYDDTGGAITAIRDQTNTGDVTDGSVSTRRPALTTSGPNSIACARFDGTSDYLTGLAISNHMTNASKFIVLSLMPNTIDTNTRIALGSSTGTVQMYAINTTSTDRLRVANFDGTADIVTITAPADAVYVLTLRHEGGTLFGSLNGAAETSVASGNTSAMTALLQFGSQNGIAFLDFDLYECVIYGATIPDATKRAAIVADFMNHIGAV